MALTNLSDGKRPCLSAFRYAKSIICFRYGFHRGVPEEYTTHAGDYNLLCIHGGPRDPIEEYVYPDSDLRL